MTRHQAEHHSYDHTELDNLIGRAMNWILAKLEAGFDPHTGLADIYARSASAEPAMGPAQPVRPALTAPEPSDSPLLPGRIVDDLP